MPAGSGLHVGGVSKPEWSDNTKNTQALRTMHEYLISQGLHYSATNIVEKSMFDTGDTIHRYADFSGAVKTCIREDFEGKHSFAKPDNSTDHAQGRSYNSAVQEKGLAYDRTLGNDDPSRGVWKSKKVDQSFA